ncbi:MULTISPECIES: LysR substrate-binding domain-containing protein [Pantoea]|uniref:LysR substrate-binding domain-containing protein n=1 Tax=Pantoea piersonii TaxID=2364647 RepID=A0AAJ5QLM5_9GAMM|nr:MULTISPECIES: LysR substrate-binding domain-containing protein [Pantoea]MCG7386967.1 LysR substrate-binding domain-containing protein [Pantoea sp. ACRSB]MDU6435106.1 LysR substrate-binding domain-containing protein [Pantoea sp.]WBG92553.1 LysR substrate-binding domain-containing protein [Pantoea piersonii]WBV23288.1 LysR substrate-binding domain-containing protein [Pantoea piersonii]
MKNLDALMLFCRVAEMMSFTRAAESLGIQKGRVSAVIRQLEADVGATLLHRTTRSVQLTEDGRAFYSRARDLLAEAEALQSMFADKGVPLRGRLRIDMPTVLAQTLFIPALPQLMEAHPDLEIELSSTDRRVDLVQEGFDCVIRLGPVVDDTLIARPMGKLRMINAASPGYLERFGTPQTIEDLLSQGHRMVHYIRNFGSKPDGWEYPVNEGYKTLMLPGMMKVNSVQTYHEAGLAGMGLIQAGYSALAPHLANGTLVEVLPALRPAPLSASFVVAHRRNLSQRVRAFMQWSEALLKPYLE